MANFAMFSNYLRCVQQLCAKYSFAQKDFIIFRNFNTHVSSAVNLVSGKSVLSEILGKLLCLFMLLGKMAVRQHGGATVLFLFIKIKIVLPLIL